MKTNLIRELLYLIAHYLFLNQMLYYIIIQIHLLLNKLNYFNSGIIYFKN